MGYLPEVVRIIAAHVGTPGGGKAIGTGFFLRVDGVHVLEEGLLLTNAHVVTNSPVVKIMTTYIEHQALPVTVVAVCHDRDLALLKIEPRVQQFLLRQLRERYQLDHIPSLSFADSDTLRTGTEVHAVGHPLGLIDQQFTTGKYQGCVHLNNEIRGLSGALINGGNSGGPLMCSTEHTDEKSIPGLHYFIPSRYEVIGVNTFKLTGANVDGENGFIHSNTVRRVLPTLMKPLTVRYEREAKVMKILSKMSVSAVPTGAPQALMGHLTNEECAILSSSGIEKAWTKYKLGGTVRGKSRTFAAWLGRHVYAPGMAHMHRGGPELLSKVLEFADTKDWDGLMEWRGETRWSKAREMVTEMKKPETRPAVVRILPPPPSHTHSPQIGVTTQPIFSADLLAHYQCPMSSDGNYQASGGVLVTSVAPKSLFQLHGGLEGDIIFKFSNESISASLTAAGTWYSETRDLPMSLTDMCNDTPIGESITMDVLRQGGDIVQVSFPHREPHYDELPDVRQTYAFCDEGRFEQQQKVQIQGMVFAPLRMHHVGMFKLLDYMSPSNRYGFKVVIESVSPESPAYATDALHAGSIVTRINDVDVPDNWKSFQECVKVPHSETGCWVIDTEYNGTKSKYAIRQRMIQTK